MPHPLLPRSLRPVLAFTASLAVSATLAASQIQVQLGGTIESSNTPLFPIGQNLSVSFIFESSSSPQFIASSQAFYVNQLLSVTLTSGSYSSTVSGPFGQINLYNFSNTDGIQFQFAREQATYQFTNPKPNGVLFAAPAGGVTIDNIFLNLASSNPNLYSTFNLPTSFNFADFDSTRNFGISLNNGSFGGGWTSLSSSVVPEPGTVQLLLAGAAGLVAWGARRRRARG